MFKRGTWLTAFLQRWKKASEATAWDTVRAVNGHRRKEDELYLQDQVTEKH